MPNDDESMPDAGSHLRNPDLATLEWDREKCIPLRLCLSKDDLILLLTPVVIPPSTHLPKDSDPFESLGQTLAERHPVVRHVPYTKANGITSLHVAFIKKADVVIFVVSGVPQDDLESSQLELAEAVREACESRPLIVVMCCPFRGDRLQQYDFSAVLGTTCYSSRHLSAVSSLLLDGETVTSPSPIRSEPNLGPAVSMHSPCTSETIDPKRLSKQDLEALFRLWTDNIQLQFRLDMPTFASVVLRDGYSLIHVAREPSTTVIIAFCLTYTTYAYRDSNTLIGSIAALIVQRELRKRGIGRMLHDLALAKLNAIRGVNHIQLGTSFPRLVHGIPYDLPSKTWFENRGWVLDRPAPGCGRIMADWLLWFSEASNLNLASAGLVFRPCELPDIEKVWDFVSNESQRKFGFGWFEQYARVLDSQYVDEVILGFEGQSMIATAITYRPNCGNPTASDMPWAATISGDIGGITCVCVKDDDPAMISRRNTTITRLLYFCCKALNNRGMAGAFLDGMKSDETVIESLGFKRWAQYLECWRRV